MIESQPSGYKRYQKIAGIVGFIGFILGSVITGVGILLQVWKCPFGNGILQTICFLVLIGLASAIVLGNLVAILLIGVAKMRMKSRKLPRK